MFLPWIWISQDQGHGVMRKKLHTNGPNSHQVQSYVYIYINATEQYVYKSSGFEEGRVPIRKGDGQVCRWCDFSSGLLRAEMREGC